MTRAPSKPRAPKSVMAWAVFSDGRMHAAPDAYYDHAPMYQLYRSRAAARRTACDVRRVLVTPVSKK